MRDCLSSLDFAGSSPSDNELVGRNNLGSSGSVEINLDEIAFVAFDNVTFPTCRSLFTLELNVNIGSGFENALSISSDLFNSGSGSVF